jgi:hypothetical protein
MSTFDGQAARRGLTVRGDVTAIGGVVTVFIERVAVQNGFAAGTGGGGGISNEGGGDLTLNNCVVANSGTNYASGGGIANAARLIVMKSTITGNMTGGTTWGGGVVNGCYLEVWDSIVSGNTAGAGGGIYNNALAKILNSTISGNEDGGFFNSVNSDIAVLINSTISDNNGGGVTNYGALYVDSCSIAYNQGTGIFYSYFPPELNLTITNSILWGNSPDQIYVKYDPPSVTYSDIEGGWVGEGNISEEPRFVDPPGGDFHLQRGSPCIDKGTNAAELLDTDFEGDPRIVDGDKNGIERVDMGADEYILINVFLTPDTLVVPRGGTLGFQVAIANNTNKAGVIYFATNVTLPNGNIYPPSGYLFGPKEITLNPHQSKFGHLSHTIPMGAPLGTYLYHGYIGRPGMGVIDEDQFDFEVIETTAVAGSADWETTLDQGFTE